MKAMRVLIVVMLCLAWLAEAGDEGLPKFTGRDSEWATWQHRLLTLLLINGVKEAVLDGVELLRQAAAFDRDGAQIDLYNGISERLKKKMLKIYGKVISSLDGIGLSRSIERSSRVLE